MPDYPGAPGRTGYAVGLDVPASIVALLGDLAEAGYVVRDAPQTPRALLERVGWAKSPSPDGMGVPKPASHFAHAGDGEGRDRMGKIVTSHRAGLGTGQRDFAHPTRLRPSGARR